MKWTAHFFKCILCIKSKRALIIVSATGIYMIKNYHIFASIPYNLNTQRDEAYFHTLFYLMVSASGADAGNEVLTCRGRIDLVAEFADKIYIMEFKCNQSAEAAIKQIRKKGYAEKYKQGPKKIILMGINFSTEKRIPAEWKTETG